MLIIIIIIGIKKALSRLTVLLTCTSPCLSTDFRFWMMPSNTNQYPFFFSQFLLACRKKKKDPILGKRVLVLYTPHGV